MSQQAEKKGVHPGLGHQQGHGDQVQPPGKTGQHHLCLGTHGDAFP